MVASQELHIICINDFHAEIFETEQTLGAAKLATAVHRYKQQNPNTVVLFGGDNYRGDPISEYCDGEPVTELMKELDVKLSVLGNHDFDFGIDFLKKQSHLGGYKFLAANVHNLPDILKSLIKPYAVISDGTIKVVIIGLSTTTSFSDNTCSKDLSDIKFSDGSKVARRLVDSFFHKNTNTTKPNAIVALTHFGLQPMENSIGVVGDEIIDLCNTVPELAGVFAAHWHRFMAIRINGVAVSQGGCRGQGFAILKLRFDESGNLINSESDYVDMRADIANIEPNHTVAQAVASCSDKAMRELGAVVGILTSEMPHRNILTNEIPIVGTPLTELVTRLMIEATNSRIALFYSGWATSGLNAGDATLYELYQAFRFNNILVKLTMTGKEIKKNIETGIRTLATEAKSPLAVNGLKIKADITRPYGKRLLSVTLDDGSSLLDDALYTVVVDDSIAGNNMGFDVSSSLDTQYLDLTIRDCVIEHFKQHKAISPCQPNNIELV